MTEAVKLPLTATYTSSHGKRGSSYHISLSVGGIDIGWYDAYGERGDQVRAILDRLTEKRSHGHSGNKYTMNPKHSWQDWQIPAEHSDKVTSALFGTTVVNELHRTLLSKNYIILKGRYCLPVEHLNRFVFVSKCRDRTWCHATRLKECPESVKTYLMSIPFDLEYKFFGEIRRLKIPAFQRRPRMLWRCEQCGTEGHYETFKDRTIPGLAGSVGLDCRDCQTRPVDGITSLLSGAPRGDVRRVAMPVLYPEG